MQKSFPWRIFSRVILIQSAFLLFLFGVGGFATRKYFQIEIGNALPPSEFRRVFSLYDSALILALLGLVFVLTLFALILGRRLVFPIGRMLIKTRSVLAEQEGTQEGSHDEDSKSYGEEAYAEWSDLESSIDAIRKDLEGKIESLETEREEQATLMGAISDAILAVDLDEAPLFYNSRFALLFGRKKLKKGTRLWEIFRNPEILEAFHRALQNGQIESVKAFPIEQPDGRRFFSISVSPLRNSRETIYGAVGVFHDVTDLKRAEQIRIDFVANVSHELRTPLTAIKGYADTLKLDVQSGKEMTPEFLEIIVRNTDRLMNLINDLLDLSSLESTDVLQKAQLSTQEVSTRVMQQMQGVAREKNQKLSFRTDASTVLADPKRLEQVLVNLLDNAIKYTPEEGTITLIWEQAPGSEDTLLKVTDSGPGIPAEHQPRLFERFYRVDKARSREKGGTGLGLAIVKHILQRHGGTVVVESAVGHGSTFTCRFPSATQNEFHPRD